MSKLCCRGGATLALVVTLAAASTAWGQNASVSATPPAKAAPAEAAKPDPVKEAFLAMPEADRKAAQDALVWLGLYNGVVDGSFGKRTLEAIEAYQRSLKATADGIVTPEELASLKSAAEKARIAVGFVSLDDKATGIRISVPLKLVDNRQAEKARTTIMNSDGSILLDLDASAGPYEALDAVFRKLSADAPGRKIAYKAMKADAFFVVSGEDGPSKFYLRYQAPPLSAPAAGPRGFTFSYPKARAVELDRIALAIANTFEPFPAAAPAPSPKPSASPLAAATPAPSASPTPSTPHLIATALIFGPGEALTALTPEDCAKPMISGAPTTYARADASSGLALLAGDFGAGVAPASFGAGAEEAIALSLAPGFGADKMRLEANETVLTPLGAGKVSALAAVTASARGAPLFDRQGALVAVLAPLVGAPRRVAGVTIAEPHIAIGAETLKTFLGVNAPPASGAGDLSAGEIARRERARIVAVECVS